MCRSATARMERSSNQMARRASSQIPGSIWRRDLSMFGDQIVIRMADNFHAGKFTDGQFATDIDTAVNVRSVGFGAGDQIFAMELLAVRVFAADQAVFPGVDVGFLQITGRGGAFDQDVENAADEGFRDLLGDLMLGGHGAAAALLFELIRDLVLHAASARAFFLGVSEDAEALEFRVADKIEQRLERGFGFAREADDESGAQCNARHAGADARNKFADVDVRG